jgi:ABC-2 type transport system permease protein
MTSLLRTEWLKIRKYNAFWWIMGVTALAYPGINYIFYEIYKSIMNQPSEAGQMLKYIIGNPFSFPETWHTVAFCSSLFVFVPAVVVIMFISNEYSFKTHRQNIIDGWSRSQFITSKLVDVLITSAIITLLFIGVALVFGFTNSSSTDKPWSLAYYVGLFALQTFAQLSIAFLVGFLVRKAFLALGIFLFYFLVFEPISAALLKEYANDIGRFLPLEMSDRIVPRPAFIGKFNPESYQTALNQVQPHVFYTILLTGLVWLICYRVHNRRDLK